MTSFLARVERGEIYDDLTVEHTGLRARGSSEHGAWHWPGDQSLVGERSRRQGGQVIRRTDRSY
jgi:hypothetical protein